MKLAKLSIFLLTSIISLNLSGQLSTQEFAYAELAEATTRDATIDEPKMIYSASTFSDIKQQLHLKINYPASMRPYDIEGISTVRVTITKTGILDNVEILESLGTAFDREINNTLKRVKKVSPVLFNGIPTKQTIVFPIQFRL